MTKAVQFVCIFVLLATTVFAEDQKKDDTGKKDDGQKKDEVQKKDDDQKKDEGPATKVNFSYKGKDGLDNWGKLSSLCSSGKHQSPIDIQKKTLVLNVTLGDLRRDYKETKATLVNDCNNIGITWKFKEGFLMVDDVKYTLKESIWHTPAEHKINGEQHAAELQHYHVSPDGKIAVVSTLYKKGGSDLFIQDMQDELAKLGKMKCDEEKKPEVPVGEISGKELIRSSHKYYRYLGSLTQPPCTENVIWIVLAKVREVSDEELKGLQSPLGPDCKENARPVQPLNDRKAYLFDSKQAYGDSGNESEDEKSSSDSKDSKDSNDKSISQAPSPSGSKYSKNSEDKSASQAPSSSSSDEDASVPQAPSSSFSDEDA